jgi:hypothetical protein
MLASVVATRPRVAHLGDRSVTTPRHGSTWRKAASYGRLAAWNPSRCGATLMWFRCEYEHAEGDRSRNGRRDAVRRPGGRFSGVSSLSDGTTSTSRQSTRRGRIRLSTDFTAMTLLTRRWLSLTRTVALGLMLGLLLTPVGMAHLHLEQAVCDRGVVHAPPGAAAVRAIALHAHDHCLTCDWLQSLGSTIVATAVVALGSTDPFQLPCPTRVERHFLPQSSVPARAPPSATLAPS